MLNFINKNLIISQNLFIKNIKLNSIDRHQLFSLVLTFKLVLIKINYLIKNKAANNIQLNLVVLITLK